MQIEQCKKYVLTFEQTPLALTEWFLSVIRYGQKKGLHLDLADTNNTRDREERERKNVCLLCVRVCE